MKNTPHIANAGEAGARFYAALTGIAPPRNDNATTGNRGEVGKAKQTGKVNYSGKKRLPAYGRDLLDHRKAGREPYHGIALWIDRKPPQNGVCAPLAIFSDTQPHELDWSLCEARSVLIPHSDEVDPDRLLAVINEVVKADPSRLILLKEAPPAFEIVYSREARQ